MTPELDVVLRRAVTALDGLGVRWAVVGGLAVSAWAAPRATRDVDLYCELPAEPDALRIALEAQGFTVPAMREELQSFGVFRSRSKPEGVFLDIFDAVGPLGEAILERRTRVSIGETAVWLITAEDLAVLKAFSDRPRDFDDLKALLRPPGASLDLDYVLSWARRLDESIGSDEVTERIRRALTDR